MPTHALDRKLREAATANRAKPPEHWFLQDLMLHRGRSMTPVPRPKWIRASAYGNPFIQAANAVLCQTGRNLGLRYAEGFMLTERLPWPVHHAWVTLARGEGRAAVEPTYDTPGIEYKGIVIDADTLEKWRSRRVVSMLYDSHGRVNWRFLSAFAGGFIRSEYPDIAANIRHRFDDTDIMAEDVT